MKKCISHYQFYAQKVKDAKGYKSIKKVSDQDIIDHLKSQTFCPVKPKKPVKNIVAIGVRETKVKW